MLKLQQLAGEAGWNLKATARQRLGRHQVSSQRWHEDLDRRRAKWLKGLERVKEIFLWSETNCSWLFYRVPHHTVREVGHLKSDSLTAVAVGPQNELSIQTHNSMKAGYCSNYFVLAVVSMPTASNYHPGGYPVFTVFLLVVDGLKSGTDICRELRQPPVRDVWMCSVVCFLTISHFWISWF